jgi:hypothetical protein
MRSLVAALVSAVVALASAVVAPGLGATEERTLAIDDSDELFVLTYRCAVLERLYLIHANHEQKMDRFIAIAMKWKWQSYVQCIFLDNDTRMLREAASGYYATLPVENRSYSVSAAGKATLARLGFDTDDSTGNFQRMIEIKSDADLGLVADLVLSTLYLVCGARLGSHMNWTSPLAETVGSAYTPIG